MRSRRRKQRGWWWYLTYRLGLTYKGGDWHDPIINILGCMLHPLTWPLSMRHCVKCNCERYVEGLGALPLVNHLVRCDECGGRTREMAEDELFRRFVLP